MRSRTCSQAAQFPGSQALIGKSIRMHLCAARAGAVVQIPQMDCPSSTFWFGPSPLPECPFGLLQYQSPISAFWFGLSCLRAIVNLILNMMLVGVAAARFRRGFVLCLCCVVGPLAPSPLPSSTTSLSKVGRAHAARGAAVHFVLPRRPVSAPWI